MPTDPVGRAMVLTAKTLASRAARTRGLGGVPPRVPPKSDAVAWAAHALHHAMFDSHGASIAGNEPLLVEAIELLEPEVHAAYRLSSKNAAAAKRSTTAAVARLVRALPAIQRVMLRDLDAAFERDPAAKCKLEVVLCYPGLRALCVYRVAHTLHLSGVPLIPRMLTEAAHDSTGIDIHPGAQIGEGFFIDHGTSVVIGETSVIGKNCTLYQGVTLGAKRFDRHKDGTLRRDSKRHPTLRDDVTVYANATILGGRTVIGKGAVISAGVLVQESVPPHHTVKAPKTELVVTPRKSRD